MRITKSGTVVVSHSIFQTLDYAQLCDRLGLKPSMPDHDAAGRRIGPESTPTAA